MKTALRTAVALALVALVGAPAARAQAKVRIAIWDFENNAERRWWFHDDLGPAARNQIDTAFSESGELSQQFSIIEREKLDLVMKEQGLGTTGALDAQSAAQVGKLLGVRYILTGGIDSFSINETKGGIGGFGAKYTKAEAEINIRLIDTTTGERVFAVSGTGDVKKGGVRVRSASLSQEAEWGIASEAIGKAAEKVVEELEKKDYASKLEAGGALGGEEGKVIKVEGNKAWINMGSVSGLKVGDGYAFFQLGDKLVDPDTGMVLGQDESQTATGQVVEVQERFAVIQFQGTAAAKDTKCT
jgi:curli biogenesis system outer membrane secretion channel CsgG